MESEDSHKQPREGAGLTQKKETQGREEV